MKIVMTTAQAARELGVTPNRLNRDARAGLVPTLGKLEGIRGANLFDPEVIIALVIANEAKAAGEVDL